MKTPQQAAQNWTASAGRASTAYQQGVEQTQKDQAALAVAAESRLLANFQQAVASGRWRQAVQAAGTGYWKSQTVAKIANYSTGFAAGGNNYQAASQKIMAALQNGVANLPPRGDVNANIERSRSLALYLHGLKGQLGAR